MSAKSDYFYGSKAQETPKKGHFMDTESLHKAFKIFNLTNLKCYSDETYHDCLFSKDI